MDPNVQVALVGVIATSITTLGVIVVAVITSRKERGKAASAGVQAGLDERDVLEKMLSLISENERKEETISKLETRNKVLTTQLADLRAQLRTRRNK